MILESLSSSWVSMNSWLTPTVLFVFLNFMIGTIAVASGILTQKNQQQTIEGTQTQYGRAPSFLERIKSIQIYRSRSQEENPFESITTTLEEPELDTQQAQDRTPTLDENPHEFEEYHNITRAVSDMKPSSGNMPVKLPRKLKKSASAKSAFRHFEEEEIVELRPSTVKAGKSKASELQTFGDDEEVDAKADDFISKFNQQLKLQRLNSITRYKDMLSRGAN